MANDRGWQRRSDEWVKASHESRKRKEQVRREVLTNRYQRAEATPPKPATED